MVMRTTLLGDNGKGLLLPRRKAAREIRRGGVSEICQWKKVSAHFI